MVYDCSEVYTMIGGHEMIEAFIAGGFGLLGVLIGGLLTFAIQRYSIKLDYKKEQVHNTALLLNDLKSIVKYFEDYWKKQDTIYFPETSIRYFRDWQQMVAKCVFLNFSQIQFIYIVYDCIYDYNQVQERIEVPTVTKALSEKLLVLSNHVLSNEMKELISYIEKCSSQLMRE